ncbi:MAG: alpha/beta fold hydrolase [Brevinema sp.]
MKKSLIFICIFLFGCSFSPDNDRTTYFVENEGAIMPVIMRGPNTKRVILFVHGGPGGTSTAIPRTEVFNELAKTMRTFFYDERGSGGARGHITEESIALPYFVRDLDAVVNSILALRSDAEIIMVGHSFGGLIAGGYASRHSSKLKALVLVSPVLDVPSLRKSISPNMIEKIDEILTRTTITSQQRARFTELRAWYQRRPVLNFNLFVEHNLHSEDYYELEGLHGSFGSLSVMAQDPLIEMISFPEAATTVLAALAKNNEENRNLTTDPTYNLSNIAVPTHMFTGHKDIFVPTQAAIDAFQSLAPGIGTTTHYSTGAVGHTAFVETPNEFLRDFRDFMNSL